MARCRQLVERRVLGRGHAAFELAAERMLSWEMHRRAGLEVVTSGRVEVGQDALIRIPLGPLRIAAPVRVVEVIDEPGLRGFTYVARPGHPETGEERFTVRLRDDGIVEADISARSQPARWFSRLGGPVTRLVQDRVTWRYLVALS